MAKKIDLEFSKNEDVNRLSVSDLNRKLEKVYLGGGKKKLNRTMLKVNLLPEKELIIYWIKNRQE